MTVIWFSVGSGEGEMIERRVEGSFFCFGDRWVLG